MVPKVSIIVPIYNVEKYLARCLDSLVGQTLEEIEIIAVNDGSTDGSLKILRDYGKREFRLIVINQENYGVSEARNAGINRASGEYLAFVDPDDWLNQDMYKIMYQKAREYECDIVMCSYVREFKTHSKLKEFDLPRELYLQNEDVKSIFLRRLIGPINDEIANPELLDAWGPIWSKLYKKDLIINNQLTFTDLKEIGTNEDSLFNIAAFSCATSCCFINKPLYHYWKENETSITSYHKPMLMGQWSKLFSIIRSFIAELQLSQDYSAALNNRISLATLGLGLNTISKNNADSPFVIYKKLKTILNNEQIQHSLRTFELKRMPVIWRAFYFCAKYRFVAGYYCFLHTIEFLRKRVR